MSNLLKKLDYMDDSDPVGEFNSFMEQLQVVIDRGDLVASSLHLDYYKPMKSGKKNYRTHCIMIDVME